VTVLLDAQVSHRIAEALLARGHDAQAITSRPDVPDNIPDAQVMELAHAEGRVVVTNNVKDFRVIAAQRPQSGQGHAGLIFVSPNTPRTRPASEGPLNAASHRSGGDERNRHSEAAVRALRAPVQREERVAVRDGFEADQAVVRRAAEDAGVGERREDRATCRVGKPQGLGVEALAQHPGGRACGHRESAGQSREDRVGLEDDVRRQRSDVAHGNARGLVLVVPAREGGDDRARVGG